MYELVIVWQAGEKDFFKYNTREEAERAGENFKIAFGNQVEWYGVRRNYNEL